MIGAFALAACTPAGFTPPAGADENSCVAVYALSRGTGVPDATRSALERVRSLFEAAKSDGRVLRIEKTRIGLEGESRLCAEPRDTLAAQNLLAQVRQAVEGVELLNVVEEPCSR